MKKIKILNALMILILLIVILSGCTEATTPDIVDTPNNIEENVENAEELLHKEETEYLLFTDELFDGYTILEVDGGDQSGHRESNAVVNIGFGQREYWAFTNEYGQLIKVIAKKIILQDDENEAVKSNGRYYWDEAKVPGTEHKDYDEGHVIADSLGGVSNAYNITPQNSILNRHGNQAYMEKIIRDAGGATDFIALITYPNNETQIPSKYRYTYVINGTIVVDEFENINPDDYNKEIGMTNTIQPDTPKDDISRIDTDGNGRVTIAEAKAAGFEMPITRDHWLYEYMIDADGDGQVGE